MASARLVPSRIPAITAGASLRCDIGRIHKLADASQITTRASIDPVAGSRPMGPQKSHLTCPSGYPGQYILRRSLRVALWLSLDIAHSEQSASIPGMARRPILWCKSSVGSIFNFGRSFLDPGLSPSVSRLWPGSLLAAIRFPVSVISFVQR